MKTAFGIAVFAFSLGLASTASAQGYSGSWYHRFADDEPVHFRISPDGRLMIRTIGDIVFEGDFVGKFRFNQLAIVNPIAGTVAVASPGALRGDVLGMNMRDKTCTAVVHVTRGVVEAIMDCDKTTLLIEGTNPPGRDGSGSYEGVLRPEFYLD